MGTFINANMNASYNILRVHAPHVFAHGIGACVLRPAPLQLLDRLQDRSKQRPRRKVRV